MTRGGARWRQVQREAEAGGRRCSGRRSRVEALGWRQGRVGRRHGRGALATVPLAGGTPNSTLSTPYP